jgi:hypothetical protein
MSVRAFRIWIAVLALACVVLTAFTIIVALRGEDTRNVVNTTNQIVSRVDSACARAADESLPADERLVADRECADNLRVADRSKTLNDSCIVFRKVMTHPALLRFTRCP